MHDVFFQGLNFVMTETHHSLQVDCFPVYHVLKTLLLDYYLSRFTSTATAFRSASIMAYHTEDSYSSLRMAVMEDLNVHAGYYPYVFIARGPIAKTALENAIFAPFAKPIFGT